MSTQAAGNVVELDSPVGFQATLDRLTSAIQGAGLTLFATIDHAAGARQAGLSMPPATVLIYGNAKGGTPVMLAAPLAALDLPLRVLVREAEGGVRVAYHPVASILPAEHADRLAPAQRLLEKALQA